MNIAASSGNVKLV